MRLLSPAGLALRALLATVIGSLVFLLVLVSTVGMMVVYLFANWGLDAWPVAVAVFVVASVLASRYLADRVRGIIRTERDHLLAGTTPVSDVRFDAETAVQEPVERLAAQFDIPTPEVRMRWTTVPLAYTTYGPEDPIVRTDGTSPVVVISEGLAAELPQDQLEAVLAHEFAHVANDDVRLVTWVLVPLVTAEWLAEADEGSSDPFYRFLVFVATIGVGIFSRGREFVADRAAAIATGSPAGLAGALERLAQQGATRPSDDLRTHAQSTNAVSVVPVLDTGTLEGLRSTHPDPDARIAQLRELEADISTGDSPVPDELS